MAEQRARKKQPTQADVARRAGVSQAMVSYVLNNNMAIAVPPETRQRIRDAIVELGYIPDRAARSLRTRKTYTIAGIIPDITNPFYPAFERGIQDLADQHGYDLITYNTDGDAEKERKCLRSVQQGRADGLIAVLFHLTAQDLIPLLDMNIAVVRLEATPKRAGAAPLDNLYVDNIAAAQRAVQYLIGKGHRRIGMITGQRGPGTNRVLGYQYALAEHQLMLDEKLIRNGDFTAAGGQQRMCELLALAERPTAVFAANDLMAMGAMNAIRAAGLRIPEDMAVVGFDNIPAAELVSPSLTTVTQFQEQIGRRAAQMLLERFDSSAPLGGRCEEMPSDLVIRESA
jgi:LacI family transcriptional regulator